MFTRIRPSSILNWAAIKPTTTSRITAQVLCYSSQSDRKPKIGGAVASDPDRQISTPAKSDKTVDPKPIGISGRGRRANHRSTQSSPSKQYGFTPKLALPFKPLSSNHLAHLRPATLFLDLFFSLQRPLLEIELGQSERRSITNESKSKQSKLEQEADPAPLEDVQEDELDYPHIVSGSPSDPAFKPPHPSSARLSSDEDEMDEHLWSTTDPYSAYLIAEPDGVHPAWSDTLKQYLASSQAFIPPPEPTVKQEVEVQVKADTSSAEQGNLRTFQSEKDAEMDRERQRALKFLNPYGLTSLKTEPNDKQPAPEAVNVSGPGESNTLPQDQLTLTMQAARFLHSGMMSNRWPTAANWAAIDTRLKAATESYSETQSPSTTKVHDFTDSFPPIRGQDRAINSGRRRRANNPRQRMTIHGETTDGQAFSFNTEQLSEIIKYSQRIIKDKLGIEAIPKPILKNLERFGEFLIHKHLKTFTDPQRIKANPKLSSPSIVGSSPMPIVIIDPSAAPQIAEQSSSNPDDLVINLDSVFRKKKRKMKVHKYKKRRKARRTLKKRQGK